MARREWNGPMDGAGGRQVKSAALRRNPKQAAGFRASGHKKTPTENGWGLCSGGGVATRNKPRYISDFRAARTRAGTCGGPAVPVVTVAHPTGSGQGQTARSQVTVRSRFPETNRRPLPITECGAWGGRALGRSGQEQALVSAKTLDPSGDRSRPAPDTGASQAGVRSREGSGHSPSPWYVCCPRGSCRRNSPDHLGFGGAPTIFWGSREPGAEYPRLPGMAPRLDPEG